MIPSECGMEDLSDLERLLPAMILSLVFLHADKDVDRRIRLYRRVYVRLVDKAINEYSEARQLILAQIVEGRRSVEDMTQDGRQIYMFGFVNHMENCILTVRRLLRFIDVLKGNRKGLPIPREIRRQIESLTRDLVGIRDVVEHMEERIQKDLVKNGEPVVLALADTQDGVSIGSQSLRFSALSTLIRQLHSLGQTMITWRAATDSST